MVEYKYLVFLVRVRGSREMASGMSHETFADSVKRMIDLQEKMAEISVYVKEKRTPLKEQADVLKDRVKSYMEETKTDVCKYNGYQLKVATVTKYGSLTRKSLKPALEAYFKGDEKKAQGCFDFIVDHIGSEDITVLRKTKERGSGNNNKEAGGAQQQQANPLAETSTGEGDEAPDLSDSDED